MSFIDDGDRAVYRQGVAEKTAQTERAAQLMRHAAPEIAKEAAHSVRQAFHNYGVVENCNITIRVNEDILFTPMDVMEHILKVHLSTALNIKPSQMILGIRSERESTAYLMLSLTFNPALT